MLSVLYFAAVSARGCFLYPPSAAFLQPSLCWTVLVGKAASASPKACQLPKYRERQKVTNPLWLLSQLGNSSLA